MGFVKHKNGQVLRSEKINCSEYVTVLKRKSLKKYQLDYKRNHSSYRHFGSFSFYRNVNTPLHQHRPEAEM
jgi:hypothetical protein